jgi:hypothetical protein
MATKVLVPLLGEGVEEVTIIKWLKKEGDSINELEPLLEVNTDKVDSGGGGSPGEGGSGVGVYWKAGRSSGQ